MNLSRIAGIALLGLIIMGSAAHASEDKKAAALEAAEAWLTLVDEGDYGQSWDQAAAYFRNSITRGQWEDALTAIRRPLGRVLSRTVKSQTYLTELPGAPDGHYVILQFDTSFEHKHSSVETVTPMLDPDGGWRVSGYYIK